MDFQQLFDSAVERFLPDACPAAKTPVQLVQGVFGSGECFKATLSMCLGLGIVVFASIIKLPQITKVISAQSAAGLSLSALVIETFGYTYNIGAHYRQSYPIWTYADFFLIFAQNLVLLNLMTMYAKSQAKGLGIALALLFFTIVSMFAPTLVPIPLLNALTSLNTVLPVMSRLPQILANARRKSTGQLSLLTSCGLCLGAFARMFTTWQSIPSMTILVGYTVSAVCNSVLVVQIFMYRNRVDLFKAE